MAVSKTLSAVEISSKDLMVMRSLIKLMGGDLSDDWSLKTEPGGDVTIVDVDVEAGSRLWEDLSRHGHDTIALTRDRAFPARHRLDKPLRSRQLISVLNELSGGAAVASSGDKSPRPMVMGLKPGNLPLAEHLRRRTWNTPILFDGWQKPPVVIDPGSGAWYCAGDVGDIESLFSASLTPQSGQHLSSAAMVEKVSNMPQRPLSDLQWAAGLSQSRGAVHPDLVGEVAFMLTHVPRQARQTETHMKIARFLTGGPRTLAEIKEESGEELQVVTTFLNACYSCGFLLIKRKGAGG